jgi:hypothetical protein
MIELSASQAPRARACPPSILADGLQVVTYPMPVVGLAGHHGMQLGIQHGQHLEVEDLAAMFGVDDIDDLERVMGQMWHAWQGMRQYFGDSPMCEVFLQHDFIKLRLSGHIDVLGFAPANRQIRIGDWKSSWQEEDHGDQIRAYALLALENYPDYDEAWCAVIRPRQGNYSAQVYRRPELYQWLEGLTERLTGRGSEQYYVGEQCIRCPRATICPAVTSLIRQELQAIRPMERMEYLLSEESMAEAVYSRIRVLEAHCEAVGKALKAKVVAAGGRIGNLILTQEKRETIRYTVPAQRVLYDLAFDRDTWTQILKVSNTELKKAVMAQAPHGAKLTQWDFVRNRLRDCGAVETTYIEKLVLRRCQDEPASESAAAIQQ